nr:orotidine-5'-phosphate decarboxylase [uncultured Roseococcus sp.]
MLSRPDGPKGRLIVAIDTSTLPRAETLAAQVAPEVGLLKLGLELFCAAGPSALAPLRQLAPVFLDLKLHDIPNTVAGALGSLAPLRPAMVTIHAAGGPAMIAAARRAAEAVGGDRPMILAVTVLTSIDAGTLRAIGVEADPVEQVVRLARMALEAGADGLVCSPREVAPIRAALGEAPRLVVPGIRPAGSDIGDQVRVATPAEAVADGADWIVVGRPITGAADPAAAARAIVASLTR